MITKAELRKTYKQKRLQLSQNDHHALSAKVIARALHYLADKPQIQHIHVFLPIKKLNEINTIPLINSLAQQNKDIYTSISDHLKKEMRTVKITSDLNFVEDEFGIPIPAKRDVGDDNLIQLIFMPLLAYDLKGHRLGYGKGFYDKFLSGLPKEVVKAGLSFFSPERQIPVELHDIPLDVCINPDEILEFRN